LEYFYKFYFFVVQLHFLPHRLHSLQRVRPDQIGMSTDCGTEIQIQPRLYRDSATVSSGYLDSLCFEELLHHCLVHNADMERMNLSYYG
jgi:hypothetical protein